MRGTKNDPGRGRYFTFLECGRQQRRQLELEELVVPEELLEHLAQLTRLEQLEPLALLVRLELQERQRLGPELGQLQLGLVQPARPVLLVACH